MGIEGEESEVKWVKHYSSNQSILLVGEGDFSFSSSLANSFGSASNIVATSLDPYDVVVKMYKNAKSNLEKLLKLGASILHGVDATTMKLHPDLKMQKFNRIIFNFPHAGFHGKEDNNRVIMMHKTLLSGFFKNARGMLQPYGEIHVSHKTSPPFSHWNIEELALRYSVALVERVDFNIQDYAGYENKRGQGKRCDIPFPLGECSTFKFGFPPAIYKSKVQSHFVCTSSRLYQYQNQLSFSTDINDFMGHRPLETHEKGIDFLSQRQDYGMFKAEAALAQRFRDYEPCGYVGTPLTSVRRYEDSNREKIMFHGHGSDGRRLYDLEISMFHGQDIGRALEQKMAFPYCWQEQNALAGF